MAVKITKKTRLVNGFKLPRKTKKAFKKDWVGATASISFKLDEELPEARKAAIDWIRMLFGIYMLRKHNLKTYKGMTITHGFSTKGL